MRFTGFVLNMCILLSLMVVLLPAMSPQAPLH